VEVKNCKKYVKARQRRGEIANEKRWRQQKGDRAKPETRKVSSLAGDVFGGEPCSGPIRFKARGTFARGKGFGIFVNREVMGEKGPRPKKGNV